MMNKFARFALRLLSCTTVIFGTLQLLEDYWITITAILLAIWLSKVSEWIKEE
jgi:hypothetical protein